MDASAASTESKDPFARVRAAELDEIVKRRSVADLAKDKESVAKNLVGLSLSGGGIRSGAIGLGILQGLNKLGILRYVDFLSTVSGGGFAGSYLSSYAVSQREHVNLAAEKPVDLPITMHADRRLDGRLREFLDTGKKINRPLVFLNRHLIGLLLLWVVVLSGLFAMAAGSAWLFRQIYNPNVLDVLAMFGFQNDLQVCLVPPLIVFTFWLAAWALSYFQYGARAAGRVARFLFFILLITLGISFAAVLGAGDIDMTKTGATKAASEINAVSGLAASIQTFVISAILAGLVPYLNPLRLFRSGAAPSSRPIEKYVYAVASRMLVFGVPFLVTSYFIQENISGWYARRDGSVFRSEIKDLRMFDPAYEKQVNAARLWPETLGPVSGTETVQDLFQRAYAGERIVSQYEFGNEQEAYPDQSSQSQSKQRPTDSVERPIWFWRRGTAFLAYAGQFFSTTAPGAVDKQAETTTALWRRALDARRDGRDAQQNIAAAISARLQDPTFAVTFLPDNAATATPATDPVSELAAKLTHLSFKDDVARKLWINNLLALRNQAKHEGERFQSLNAKNEASAAERRRLIEANRRLVQAYYGDALSQPSVVFSGVVWEYDQRTRGLWFLTSLGVFLIASVVIDLNATSCHGFYAQHTAEGWIESLPGVGRNIPLAQLESTRVGMPYHLISGSVRMNRNSRNTDSMQQRAAFLFSQRYCGSDALDYVETSEYMGGHHTLPDAIAASGGAVSPTQSNNPLAGALLVLTNFRLGQWLENPAFKPLWPWFCNPWRKRPFTAARWMLSRPFSSVLRSFVLVADGGHYENLGVEALLRRRCKLVIAMDAGQDRAHEFDDFLRLVRRMQIEYGVTLEPLNVKLPRDMLDGLTLPEKVTASTVAEKEKKDKPEPPPSWTREHFVVLRIRYPQGETGLMFYLKSSLTGDESLDLIHFQRRNPMFPHDATGDQLYNADQFLSYMQLGTHIAEKVGELLPKQGLDVMAIDELERHVSQQMQASQPTPPKPSVGATDSLTVMEEAIRAVMLNQHRPLNERVDMIQKLIAESARRN